MGKRLPVYADAVCGHCGEDAICVDWYAERPDVWIITCPNGHETDLSEAPIQRTEDGRRL